MVTFQHTAYSKAIFGKGAVQAAKFLAGKGPRMVSDERCDRRSELTEKRNMDLKEDLFHGKTEKKVFGFPAKKVLSFFRKFYIILQFLKFFLTKV